MSDNPSRLEDPYLYSATVIVEKDGITTEVLTADLAHYKQMGYTEVGPGKPLQQTSYIDKKKVAAFNAINHLTWLPPSRH